MASGTRSNRRIHEHDDRSEISSAFGNLETETQASTEISQEMPLTQQEQFNARIESQIASSNAVMAANNEASEARMARLEQMFQQLMQQGSIASVQSNSSSISGLTTNDTLEQSPRQGLG